MWFLWDGRCRVETAVPEDRTLLGPTSYRPVWNTPTAPDVRKNPWSTRGVYDRGGPPWAVWGEVECQE